MYNSFAMFVCWFPFQEKIRTSMKIEITIYLQKFIIFEQIYGYQIFENSCKYQIDLHIVCLRVYQNPKDNYK